MVLILFGHSITCLFFLQYEKITMNDKLQRIITSGICKCVQIEYLITKSPMHVFYNFHLIREELFEYLPHRNEHNILRQQGKMQNQLVLLKLIKIICYTLFNLVKCDGSRIQTNVYPAHNRKHSSRAHLKQVRVN